MNKAKKTIAAEIIAAQNNETVDNNAAPATNAPVVAGAGEEEEEWVEPPLNVNELSILQKDYTVVKTWEIKKEDIVPKNVSNKCEIYVVKPDGNGSKVLGSMNLRFPVSQAIFTSIHGLGEIPKMGDKLGLGFLASPCVPDEMAAHRATIESQWAATFEFLDNYKSVFCGFLADNPMCNSDVYDELIVSVKRDMSPADSALITEFKFDANGAKVLKKASERGADMQKYKKIVRDAMYKQLMNACKVHWKDVDKWTDKRVDRSRFSTFTIGASSDSFKPLYEKVANKSFEDACPEIAKFLHPSANKQDERYALALKAREMFHLPPGPDKNQNNKIVDQRKIFAPIRTYCSEPRYDQDGKLIKGNDGKPVLGQKQFGIFERRLTNRDAFTFEAFMGVYKFSKTSFGILCTLNSIHIVVPKEHEDYVRDAPTSEYDNVAIVYPERRELPPAQAYQKRSAPEAPAAYEGSNFEQYKNGDHAAKRTKMSTDADYETYVQGAGDGAGAGPSDEEMNNDHNNNNPY
jgi:hypothetical protein